MIAPLDVFAIDDSDSRWLGCAETLAEAVDLIQKTGPGSYLVFSQPRITRTCTT
jgi:hypothetical protein